MKFIADIFKIKKNINYRNSLERAIFWIEKYSINSGGVAVTSIQPNIIYPEVTGYYIPTLLLWGKRNEAIKFADYLILIQNTDGSWNAPNSETAYTFDIGQILKGLISLVDEKPEYRDNIIKGCDWILMQQREDGSIATPDYSAWGLPGGKRIPEAVHLYALEPLKIAAEKWGISKYDECVEKALEFYLAQSNLTDFNTLSHFHAYIIEALIDLGQTDRAREAMENVAKYQHKNGSVPAYCDAKFVCSTGLFQYAICWYKINDLERGNRAFEYAVKLQNETGGWYGSYGRKANYFPNEEISWAVKYFLDALYWKMHCEFNAMAHIFPTQIDENDGRYIFIENELRKNNYKKVIDIGCGKGRFIGRLKERNFDIEAYGVDISEEILKSVTSNIETRCGSLLKIPYPDDTFDLSFCIEALEHAVFIEGAIQEMVRVTKPGGSLVIIDKNIEKLGCMKLPEWECWFSAQELAKIMTSKGLTVSVQKNIPYDKDNRADDLFIGWIGKKQ
jgi:malonyl-CoA O-methyltransferase